MSEYSIRKVTSLSGVTDVRFVDSSASTPTFSAITTNGLISGSSISINGGEEMTRIPSSVDFQLFGNQSSTGLIDYGGLSANTSDNTKFDVGVMKGWIVDNTTNPEIPAVQYIDYSGGTGITLTYLATNPVTYIGLSGNTTADVVQSTTPFDPGEHRDFLELGVVIHSDNTIVNVTNNLPAMGIDPTGQLYDLMHGIGYFNLGGNKYSTNGSNLNIDKSGGDIFAHGSNYTNDPKNPHIKTLLSGSALTFRYRISDSTEWDNTTDINPDIYELGGTTASTPTNKFTVQRIAVFPSGISRLQYGQSVYDSLDDGEASLSTEPFIIENNIDENALLRGFIVIREGTTDLTDNNFVRFIESNHFGNAEDTVVGNVHRTEIVNHGSTGLRDGGLITADSATTFKVAAGSGLIINNATDPTNPTLSQIFWGDITGQTITALSGDVATVIMIDSTENVVQFPLQSPPSQTDKRDKILLGVVAHSDKATITNLYNGPIHIISPVNQHEDLTSAIGTFSINGNFISGIAGTIELEKTAGDSFYYGGNYQTDKSNPSVLNTIQLSGSSTPSNPLVYATGSEVLGVSGYSIDTGNYDPSGAGTVTGLGTNKFTAHRIWHLPINNLLVFQYGQAEYNSLSLGIDGFSTENFVEPPGLNLGAYLISVVIVKEGNTDLSDAGEVKFIQQGKFAGVGGGGGSVADTLQSAYLNSSSPEITIDDTRKAVDFVIGPGVTGGDSANLVTFQASGGTINAYITGEGNATFSGQVDTNTARIISTPTQDNAGTDILVRNTTTGVIEYRQASTFSGATDTNYYVTGGTSSGDTTLVLHRNDAVDVVVTGITNQTLFNTHTGDTANPHLTAFSSLTTTAHTHVIGDVTNLQTTLNTKVDGGLNVGSGTGLFRDKTGTTLNFKTLQSSGSSVDIVNGGDVINLEVTHIPDTNTFVTGFTYDGINQHTINLNNGSAYTTTITSFSADTISATTFYGDGSNLTGIESGSGTGLTSTITVGENVVSGDLLYLNTDGKYWKADNTSESTSSTELRISNATILADASGEGIIQDQYITTGLTSGSTYWVGLTGSFTDTQPTVNGSIVRYVGTAINDTILDFNPDGLYVEISSNPSQVTNPAYREATTSTNILSTDWTVDVTTTGATTQTLPTAVGIAGRVYNVKNSDSTEVGVITMDTTSSQLVDTLYTSVAGGNPITITYPNSLTFQSNGVGWILI